MKQKYNYAFVDIAKLFFAFGIVALHTGFLLNYKIGYYIHAVLFRLGVPFFFLTSGYFFGNNCNFSNKNHKLFKYIKKLIKPYLLLSSIYFILSILRFNNYSCPLLIDNIWMIITGRSYSVMWFVGALICSAIVMLHINTKKVLKISIIISITIYLIGLLFNTYNFLLIKSPMEFIYNFLISKFHNNSNFLFIGYMYFSLGYYFSKYGYPNILQKKRLCIFISIISFIILFLETILVRHHTEVLNSEYYLSHIIIVPILLYELLKINIQINTKKIRKLSTNIYFFHYIFIILLLLFNKIIKKDLLLNPNYFYFSTLFLTLIFSYIYENIKIKKN